MCPERANSAFSFYSSTLKCYHAFVCRTKAALTPDGLSLSTDKDSGGKSVMAGRKGGCSTKIDIIMHTTYLYSMIPYIYISFFLSPINLPHSLSFKKARGLYD